MSIIQIVTVIYIVVGLAVAPTIFKMARAEFETNMDAGKVPPGTEIIGLLVSQTVSVLLWPLTGLLWAVGFATQRLKRQR